MLLSSFLPCYPILIYAYQVKSHNVALDLLKDTLRLSAFILNLPQTESKITIADRVEIKK